MNPILHYIAPKFEAVPKADALELLIYGTIGGGIWTAGVTAKSVRNALAGSTAKVINVHIQSNGGDAFEGVAIGNVLKSQKATINVFIDGMAASTASVIAMAGDTITMPKNAMLMIHRASTIAFGNAADMQKASAMLAKVDEALEQSYTDRFKGTTLELEKMLDDETWLTAQDALSYGLCDVIADPQKDDDDAAHDPDESEDTETDPDSPVPEPGGGDPDNLHEEPPAAAAEGFNIAAMARALTATNKNLEGELNGRKFR